MRRLMLTEEQYEAMKYALEDVPERYETTTDNEMECEAAVVRNYGKVLRELYNKEFTHS